MRSPAAVMMPQRNSGSSRRVTKAWPKARLVATLKAAGIDHSEDPTNRDPRYARARLRTLMPALAREGLDANSLARLAARMRRAEATIEFAVAAARAALTPEPWRERGPIVFEAVRYNDLPAEVALRLLSRAIAHAGNEGPVELGKLELLLEALRQALTEVFASPQEQSVAAPTTHESSL